ncbi:unnamed protein product [Effrenium voratum]|uniref:Uncharacterized protein n=1 Tax=Effrenium voratum TaxID=2562239 RepID=A0AA36HRY5_9DINO|nr:unnamed protein product [Effrenium voratum]CAJ1373690.1 unnamed protein product [Effrenium voratum]CAJ1427630.1 unnamed protein product [Effrenium voratum]
MGAGPSLRQAAAGLCLALSLQGCGQEKSSCAKNDATCEELRVLRKTLGTCNGTSDLFAGLPQLRSVSASCAAVEFHYAKDLAKVYIYGLVAKDAEFSAEWGEGQKPLALGRAKSSSSTVRRYRALMQKLPPGKPFEVKLADQADAKFGGLTFSCASTPQVTQSVRQQVAAPFNVQLHRTDPRVNVKKQEDSVCIDLHWSHPQPSLRMLPEDAYFRILTQYEGEEVKKFCEDKIGQVRRNCGVPTAHTGESYSTICGLWPKRRVTFTVEAFNCDGGYAFANASAVLPPAAPVFTASLITTPGSQETSAGFWPKVVIDWIPQHHPLIQGHAIYLALTGIGAMKLLCWIPLDRKLGKGHLQLPIQQKNHTHARDAAMLHDYLERYKVHQEQQVLVATRSSANNSRGEILESPVSAYSLKDWLIMERYVKCLTSFGAANPSYVSRPVQLSWTEEQSMMLYD